MKKIFLLLIFILFFTSFTSSTLVEIHSSNNQEIHVTPIKTTSKFEKLEETKILTTNEKGISIIDFDLNEPFYLEVKLNNLKNTTKIFREDFSDTNPNIIEFFPEENNSLIPNKLFNNDKEELPEFIITGFAIYNENKNIIVPVYYSLIAFLSIILLFNIIFKKSQTENLKEKAEDLLNKEKIKEAEKNLVNAKENLEEVKKEIYEAKENNKEKEYKKEMESIPEMEPYSDGKEIKEKIKEEETDVDGEEVFKESEEVLESEVKKEIKEEKEKPKDLPKKGQPAPVNSDTGKIEDTKELIDEAKKLEKN